MTAVRELYHANDLPLFQNKLFASGEAARDCARGDIRLVEHLETGLVYNDAFRPELMHYDTGYDNEQAASPTFQRHLEYVRELVGRRLGRDGIVEIGCGKGHFLEMMLEDGFDVMGYDPTYEGDNERVVKDYFDSNKRLRARGLILRHVLEHVRDPFDFLVQLKEANGGMGYIYIEVPCFDWICARRAWFDIFYEHVNYFRLSDFTRMFGAVTHVERTFGGQYLSVVGDLASLRPSVRDPGDAVHFPSHFNELDGVKPEGPFAVWGAGSKGVIFSIVMDRNGYKPQAVIDVNPKKQNKYLPVTGIQVSSPEAASGRLHRNTSIIVMNGNYLDEIRATYRDRYRYYAIDHAGIQNVDRH